MHEDMNGRASAPIITPLISQIAQTWSHMCSVKIRVIRGDFVVDLFAITNPVSCIEEMPKPCLPERAAAQE